MQLLSRSLSDEMVVERYSPKIPNRFGSSAGGNLTISTRGVVSELR